MINPDMAKKANEEIKERIKLAIEAGDTDAQTTALMQLAEGIQGRLLDEHRSMTAAMLEDRNVLTVRGASQLTSAERKFYNAVIEAKDGYAGVEEIVPPSIFNRVFEYLVQRHELLKLINFQAATATTEWLLRKTPEAGKADVPSAWWGDLTSSLKEIVINSFETFRMSQHKMTAFIPVHKSMLAIGPEWLDRYVREYLAEAMAIGLETSIIKGTGKNEPVGMMKNMTTFDNVTGYPDKTAVELPDLSPESLGAAIMAPLTKEGKREASDVILLVNPLDYWRKIFPATAFLTPGGSYAFGVLPIPAKIIQCVAVPQGIMVAGIASDYFMGIGAPQQMLTSDEAMFLEDKRVYAQKIIANGRPMDNDSFLVFDISGLSVLQDDMRGIFVSEGEDTE